MSYNNTKDLLIKIFNRNIPIEEIYSEDEIKIAFQKESYSSGTQKEQKLYYRFFKECANNDDVKELVKFCGISITKLKRLYISHEKYKKVEFGFYWSKKFNLPKVKEKITPRSSDIYKEIDNFGTYELTPCISYEMAKRNDQVKKLLDSYQKISDMCDDPYYLLNRFFTRNTFAWMYGITDEKTIDEKYNEYRILFKIKQNNYEKLIKTDYKNFIDNYIDKCTELTIATLLDLTKMIESELINDYLIYPTGYRRQVKGLNTLYQEQITNKKQAKGKFIVDNNSESASSGWQLRSQTIVYDEFIQDQEVYLDGKKTLNHIFPNFSRQVNNEFEINTPINFALSSKEILDYIEKIKKQICPKITSELLGVELKKADDITNLTTIDSKGKLVVLDMSRGEEPQKKFADMLYVYDMKKKGFTNSEIISQIYSYHETDKNKNTGMSEHTLNKYLIIATNFIETLRYKELITGKVANNF